MTERVTVEVLKPEVTKLTTKVGLNASGPSPAVAYRETTLAHTRSERITTWEQVAIKRQIGTCAGSFEISGTLQPGEAPIRLGLEVSIAAGDDEIFRGLVESAEVRLEGARSVRYSGREKTGDLVDCAADATPGEWLNIEFDELVRRIVEPFDIEFRPQGPLPRAFDRFKIRPGETCWSAIERAARLRGELIQGDGLGRLERVRMGTEMRLGSTPGRIAQGENVRSATLESSLEDRFRFYRVVGQRPGSNAASGETVALVMGEAEDLLVPRPRRLLIVAEGNVDTQTAKERAQWEAAFRATQATRLTCSVPGWRKRALKAKGAGGFWAPNEVAHVEISDLGLSETMLVDTVVMRQSRGQGSETTLELVRRDAYTLRPQVDEEGDPWEGMLDELGDESGEE